MRPTYNGSGRTAAAEQWSPGRDCRTVPAELREPTSGSRAAATRLRRSRGGGRSDAPSSRGREATAEKPWRPYRPVRVQVPDAGDGAQGDPSSVRQLFASRPNGVALEWADPGCLDLAAKRAVRRTLEAGAIPGLHMLVRCSWTAPGTEPHSDIGDPWAPRPGRAGAEHGAPPRHHLQGALAALGGPAPRAFPGGRARRDQRRARFFDREVFLGEGRTCYPQGWG